MLAIEASLSARRTTKMISRLQRKHCCELLVIQCAPCIARDEFINFAILLRESNEATGELVVNEIEFSSKFDRLHAVHHDFDVEAFTSLLPEIQEYVLGHSDLSRFSAEFRDRLPGLRFDVKSARALMTTSVPNELSILRPVHLPDLTATTRKAPSARDCIVSNAEVVFEGGGILCLIKKKIPVAAYSYFANSMRIDWGYKCEIAPVFRMIHAVPLSAGQDHVFNSLVNTWDMLQEQFPRATDLDCTMTAIVESQLRPSSNRVVGSRWELLESRGISVCPVDQMKDLVTLAKSELLQPTVQ